MAVTGYPTWEYDRGMQITRALGSFWSEVFEDRDKINTLYRASANEQRQTYLNFIETVACLSRFTVPVFHSEYWHLITVTRSEVARVMSVYQPDDLVYGPQAGTQASRPAGFTQLYGGEDNPYQTQIPLPDNLETADCVIQNTILSPTRVWVYGIDYEIDWDRRLLRFRNNIFDDSQVVSRDIYDSSGNKVDEEVSIWVYNGKFDLDYVYKHFGYVLNVRLKSSQFYKDFLNAFWDLHVLGPSVRDISFMLSSASGVPVALTDETVEVVKLEEVGWLIVTDKNVYRLPTGATPTVVVGEELSWGEDICDAINLIELGNSNPSFSDLPQISLGKNYLSGSYFGEITFRNQSVALDYEGLDEDGKAKISCRLEGWPGDSDAFWDAAQAAGKVAGDTPANLLDTRTDPADEPTALSLPSTLNPLHFVVGNFFNTNLFIINVNTSSFADNAPGLGMFRYLRDILPPHITYFTYLELTPDLDIFDLSEAGDDTVPGATDSATEFTAVAALDEAAEQSEGSMTATLTYEDVAVSARQVSVTCL